MANTEIVAKLFKTNPFIPKYFDYSEGQIICKHIPVYGAYNKVLGEYLAVYKSLELQVGNVEVRYEFQNAITERLKQIQPDTRKDTTSVVEGEDVLMGPQDFPGEYENMQHKDDYKRTKDAIKPTIVYNDGEDKNERVTARFSWRSNDAKSYIPMSFICDTGATRHIYLSDEGFALLRVVRTIKKDELGTRFVEINNVKTALLPTPENYKPANLIGLPLLARFGLQIDDQKNVKFCKAPEFF